jgi:hypothetical protein
MKTYSANTERMHRATKRMHVGRPIRAPQCFLSPNPSKHYQVAQNNYGFYVAIFEDGVQVFTI